jgi:single-stranded-DNA-specific exonuclease
MLKSKAKWQFSQNEIVELTEQSLIERLLIARGLHDEEERRKFLQPSIHDLASPELFNDIKKVKERIQSAIAEKELIVVYGDYDADGVTATTVMYRALQKLGANCHFYIPNRFTEGYGMNKKAIEHFAEQNVALIITVDNGIANVSEVELANDLGMDVIITDHHEVQDELPNAFAIIHPHLSENYPYKYLAGVGIAFQVARYLLETIPSEFLDLVAIGTVADMVPLTGENRILVYEGLKRLNQTESVGLQKLFEVAKLNREITEREIGFVIGPRLNAVGRIQDATLAVELLLTDNDDDALMIATEIDELNYERQKMVEAIVNEAENQLDDSEPIIILANETWHEGVLGIAASRLVNKYDRPTILLTENKETGHWKGSGRSIPGFNLFDNCMEIKHLFANFGGHSQAAGMTIAKENLGDIKTFLQNRIKERYMHLIGKPVLTIDHKISLADMIVDNVNELMQFAPFGLENEEPLFLLEAIPTQIRQIGQDNRHLKLQFSHSNGIVEAIGFNFGRFAPYISQDVTVSIVGELQLNEWNGNVTVQMNIKDLAVDEWQLFDYRGKRHVSYVLPYVNHYKHNVIVCHSTDDVKDFATIENVDVITYDMDIQFINKTDVLYIYDLPNNLQQLKKVLFHTKPQSVHVAYDVKEDAFLHSIPTREQFKAVYVYLATYRSVALRQHLPHMVKILKLRKELINFILRVFHDLQFISVEDNVVTLNQDVEKKALTKSKTYQERLAKSEVERVLYYSTYDELKQWINEHSMQAFEEELTYGL